MKKVLLISLLFLISFSLFGCSQSSSVNSYTVKWDVDGTITTEIYKYGDTPSYKNGTPSKSSTAKYSYEFTGWVPSITEVTSDITYRAQFSSSVNSYTVKWDVDGTITTEIYKYGDTPSYKNGTPSKSSTAKYSYEFTGWVPSITEVTSDITYRADFASCENWDGTTLEPSVLENYDGVYYYNIYTGKELAYIASVGGEWLSYNYMLKNDIFLNRETLSFNEDGLITVDTSNLNKWNMISNFTGIFDGNNHTIHGLYMSGSGKQAFFESIDTDLKNLNFDNSYVYSSEGSAAGICIDNGSKKIINCSFDGCVNGKSYVGGIVSETIGYVIDSTNNASVFGHGNYVGGISGYLTHWGIEGCVNNGNIVSSGDYVGGISGHTGLYTYSKCTNNGNVKGHDYVGGLTGYGEDSWSSGNNNGKVEGHDYVGGLIGYVSQSKDRGSTTGNNTGDVSGNEYVGGLLGYLKYLKVFDSNNTGNVTGNNYVGGLAGYSESIWGRGSFENCSFEKTDTKNANLTEFGNSAGEEGKQKPDEEYEWDGTTLEPSVLENYDGVYYYNIYTGKELAYIASVGGEWLSYNYMLKNDIFLNRETLSFNEDGLITVDTSNLNKWNMISNFTGIFDGNNHTIHGLYMSGSGKQAFFESIDTDLKNLNFDNSYVYSSEGSAAGICIDNGSKKIINCSFDGCVNGKSYVGGIVSETIGYVIDSTNNASVFGHGNYVGGISGYLTHWGIEGCVNNGNIVSSGDYVGGISGHTGLYTYSKCTNNGNVKGHDYVGGLTGYGEDSWSSGNNNGKVEGHDYVGGLIGYVSQSKDRGSTTGNNTGDVSGNEYVGGLLGYLKYLKVFDSNNTGNVTGNNYVGGLAGYSESIWGRGSFENCSFEKTDTKNANLTEFGNSPS